MLGAVGMDAGVDMGVAVAAVAVPVCLAAIDRGGAAA